MQKQMPNQMPNQMPFYPPPYPGYSNYSPYNYPCMANNFFGSVPNPYMYGQPFNPPMGQLNQPYNMYAPMSNQYQYQSYPVQQQPNLNNPRGGNLSSS